MKQAYEREYRGIEVLPIIESGDAYEYQLVRRKVFFGLMPWTYWLNKYNIKWYDMPSVEYYDRRYWEEDNDL